MMSQKCENVCEKSFVKVYMQSLSLAVKLSIIRCIEAEHQLYVCRTLDLAWSAAQSILETKDKISEYGFMQYSVYLEPVKSTKWGMLVSSFIVLLSSHKSLCGSDCDVCNLACGSVQLQKLPQQSMVEFIVFFSPVFLGLDLFLWTRVL